jgi:succinate dehydrogenase/fumarate reductase flavoprotein subunit
MADHSADLTVVGGGLVGLVASIAAAEAGAGVHLYEAHHALGGRTGRLAAPAPERVPA